MRKRAVLVLTAMTVALVMAASPAWASTFTVNTANDLADTAADGECDANAGLAVVCTLRAAIQEANAPTSPGADEIEFEIPPNSPNCNATTTLCTISPATGLPAIDEAVSINGYTQGTATENTATQPGQTNAILRIEISGGAAPAGTNGLLIRSGPTTVRGLVINNFGGSGIAMLNIAGNTDNVVEGNFLGTDPGGTLDEGNGIDGVQCFGLCTDSRIGGPSPADRNLASGNGRNGIFINSDRNTVQGNLVGTNRNGTAAPNDLGNDQAGIGLITGGADDNVINQNTVAFNGGPGVEVRSFGLGGFRNRITRNSIFDNGNPDGLGIDLGGDGVTDNDNKDPDGGPNRLQNFPVLTSATTVSGTTTIRGKLNSTPSTRKKKRTFIVEFFSNPAPNFPTLFGEGETFLGQKRVTTNRKGNASLTFSTTLPPGEPVVSATATNVATGDTSEFSEIVFAN